MSKPQVAFTPRQAVQRFVSYARHYHRIGRVDLARHNMQLARTTKAAALKFHTYESS